jgi:hypothetical protein
LVGRKREGEEEEEKEEEEKQEEGEEGERRKKNEEYLESDHFHSDSQLVFKEKAPSLRLLRVRLRRRR